MKTKRKKAAKHRSNGRPNGGKRAGAGRPRAYGDEPLTALRVPKALADAVHAAEKAAKLAVLGKWVADGCPAKIVTSKTPEDYGFDEACIPRIESMSADVMALNRPDSQPLANNRSESSEISCVNQI